MACARRLYRCRRVRNLAERHQGSGLLWLGTSCVLESLFELLVYGLGRALEHVLLKLLLHISMAERELLLMAISYDNLGLLHVLVLLDHSDSA